MTKRKHKKTNPTETIIAASGTIAGAAMGSIAGPVGTIAGAIVGSVAGAAAGAVLEDEDARESLHDAELDEEIGVYDGTLGAAPKDAPPARIGAFSAASSGARRPSVPPTEGPMTEVEK